VVGDVFPKSPAAKAGLKDGDIIRTLNGKPVADGRELQRVVGTLPLKKPVEVTVVRDGKTLVIPVTVEEQPDNYGHANRQTDPGRAPKSDQTDDIAEDKVGIEVTDLTPELAERFKYKESAKGVVITGVKAGSSAAEAGVSKGMLITKIDKKPVTTATAARELLEKASLQKGVLLQVQYPQDGGSAYIVLKAEPANK
jgi:serine protease Do